MIPEIPLKVEYSLTAYEESLIPLMELMNRWGEAHQKKCWHLDLATCRFGIKFD
ncbi:winged helix-turn-helix transcriptional regulator [Paenibacillus xylanivorans]|uniref:winged helix-turn-helix transcriptional regulator n=1 Tax=Paenibacillus xylanivorans TaxID=1705561 RepID=UPI0009E6DE43